MKTRNYLVAMMALAIFSFAFTSCEKEADTSLAVTETTVSDYDALLSIMDLGDLDESTETSAKSTELERCFDVTIHTNDNGEFWPRAWTFTYADATCTDPHGNSRSGIIDIVLTDHWKNENSSRTVTYNDFFFNDDKIEGTRSIMNTGLNNAGFLTFARKFEDAKITKPDGAIMTWNTERFVEMTAGSETFPFADDEYLVTGGATGTNYDGVNFTVAITEALHYRTGCFFPISGLVTIEADGQSPIVIDYGTDECDNLATSTQDGVVTDITLGRK